MPPRRSRGDGAGRHAYIAAMSAPVLAYENLGLVQGSGWLFRGIDLFIGGGDRPGRVGRDAGGENNPLQSPAGLSEGTEERRVWEECRYRWWPHNLKKKK